MDNTQNRAVTMFDSFIEGISGIIAIGLIIYIGFMIFTHLPK